MTRGRKKDFTIPPSRALTQQRDYRARKAQYITELEERCKKAEDENAKLRRELEITRAEIPPSASISPEMAQASSELMQQLEEARAALERFQRLAFTDIGRPGRIQRPPEDMNTNTSLRPAHFPPPPSSTSAPLISPPPRLHPNYKRLFREAFPRQQGSPGSHRSETMTPEREPPPLGPQDRGPSGNLRQSHSRSPSLDSECCGGIINCDGLIEEDER